MLEDTLYNQEGLSVFTFVSHSHTVGSLVPLYLYHKCMWYSHVCWGLTPEVKPKLLVHAVSKTAVSV